MTAHDFGELQVAFLDRRRWVQFEASPSVAVEQYLLHSAVPMSGAAWIYRIGRFARVAATRISSRPNRPEGWSVRSDDARSFAWLRYHIEVNRDGPLTVTAIVTPDTGDRDLDRTDRGAGGTTAGQRVDGA